MFTTEKERPDEGPNRISATRDVWVRTMNNGDVELYHDGNFIASWGKWTDSVAVVMMRDIYDYAFKAGEAANAKKLREALGLETGQ